MTETTFTFDWDRIMKDIVFYRDTYNKIVREGLGADTSTEKHYLVCISWKHDGKTSVHPFDTLEKAVQYADNFEDSSFCKVKLVKVL